MARFVCAGAGFLLAVLWFDLMFDVQVARIDRAERPEDILGSISGYYQRVTTAARPMNRFVALAMAATIASLIVQIASGDRPRWVGWVALALALGPIVIAASRTVPRAVRLGARTDSLSDQRALARSIYRDHLICVAAISALLAVELSFA